MRYDPIPNTRVLGITGRAGHGKDEAAHILMRLLRGRGSDARRYTFSDAIAIYARIARGMKERDPKVLQDVGMELRDENIHVWTDCVYWQIHDHKPADARIAPSVALIAGVRFEQEAKMIRDTGGKILRVIRKNADFTDYVKGDRDEGHRAEGQIEMIKSDFIVQNYHAALYHFERDLERIVLPELLK